MKTGWLIASSRGGIGVDGDQAGTVWDRLGTGGRQKAGHWRLGRADEPALHRRIRFRIRQKPTTFHPRRREVFERQTHWVEQRLNEVAARFVPDEPHSLELHGSPLRGGKDGWRKIPRPEREQAIKDALYLGIVDLPRKNAVRLRASDFSSKSVVIRQAGKIRVQRKKQRFGVDCCLLKPQIVA